MATQNEQEIQFLTDAVVTARQARTTMIKAAAAGGKVVDFKNLRLLDMDIKTCEDELRRSKCH